MEELPGTSPSTQFRETFKEFSVRCTCMFYESHHCQCVGFFLLVSLKICVFCCLISHLPCTCSDLDIQKCMSKSEAATLKSIFSLSAVKKGKYCELH